MMNFLPFLCAAAATSRDHCYLLKRLKSDSNTVLSALCNCGREDTDAVFDTVRQVLPRGAIACSGQYQGKPYSLATEGECILLEAGYNTMGSPVWVESREAPERWMRRTCNRDVGGEP